MDGADWLRTQLTSFGCATCGRAYSPGQIRILAQREELFFVDMGCETCGAQAVAVVTIQLDEADDPYAETGDLELAVAPGDGPTDASLSPVGTDDLLDMSRFLVRFDGDFQSLFRDPDTRRDPGPSGT
ncbi:MAG: hypothetical protein M3452_00545 [Chloroflexota bacterium]|nr:hypothetical protein [Chloroflexota bacterium]